ncbi:hypothetical protein Ancab_036858 [Ancistrocladus abbreviatus]
MKPIVNKEKWVEKIFDELEPVLGKISAGFRNNYMVAREKVNQELDIGSEFAKLGSIDDYTELEWMNNDEPIQIVFRVRDNELAGRIERKIEKENEKLSTLHERLHSNIENLDYGAEEIPDCLNNTGRQQESTSTQKTNESPLYQNVSTSQEVSNVNSESRRKASENSNTVIETSDGSVRPGKKSGKVGFLESYNAKQDPEVKDAIREIREDLDRWITEKEIQEAADLMGKLPQRENEIIEKKLKRIRREMELFGPQAVVSKYCEYAEEKEEVICVG